GRRIFAAGEGAEPERLQEQSGRGPLGSARSDDAATLGDGVDRARTRDLGVAPDPATRPATPADVVATVRGLGKCYHLYRKPADRLRQFLFGRRRRFYREFWALRGVDLEVRRGETLGIVGANGAGKSTLLQMLAGTLTPTEGTVETDGRITALLELGSGFYGEDTGRENAVLAGTILG